MYQPNPEKARISYNEWNIQGNSMVYSPNKFATNNDQSDYNHYEICGAHTTATAMNNTQNLKLCDYLKVSDPRPDETEIGIFQGKQVIPDDDQKYGANISFESLSAVAKIFSNNFKADQDSELDFDDERINRTNIEEVNEEGILNLLDKINPKIELSVLRENCKRNSHPDPPQLQNDDMQSNILLINAIKNSAKQKAVNQSSEAVSNSVIIESEKIKYKKPKRHSKNQRMNVSNRKFNVRSKKENDSQVLYNEDYKDYIPKKRHTVSGKKGNCGNRRSRKALKQDGRISNRKQNLLSNGHKGSHKRSQSLSKSNTDSRYKSVPQNGYQNDQERLKNNFVKAKFNTIINNRTPQINQIRVKNNDAKLELSLRNAKKNLHSYFRESNNFASLTGRDKGKVLLRKVYARNDMNSQVNKRNESIKKGKISKTKDRQGRFISPIFKAGRSNSRKVDNHPSAKGNVMALNKIQNLLTNIRTSRSNKMGKPGADVGKKSNAYKHDAAGYKSTLEPKLPKYQHYNNLNTINHHEFYDGKHSSTKNHKKHKVLKYFNGPGRQVLHQL